MDDQFLAVGDIVTATVTKALPFGVLVGYADVSGLAKGVDSAPGDKLTCVWSSSTRHDAGSQQNSRNQGRALGWRAPALPLRSI